MKLVEGRPIGNHAEDAAGVDAQRRDPRDSLLVLAHLRLEDGSGRVETVRVRNVSSGGLMAQTSDAFRNGARVTVELEGIGSVGASVAWAEAGRIGIAFDHPIDKARARKAKGGTPKVVDDQLFRPMTNTHKRPPIKPR